MLLAGDVGGTKTFLGLFARGAERPDLVEVHAYRTLDFGDLGALIGQFFRDCGTNAASIEAAGFGVAGPVEGTVARLTNVPWLVDLDELKRELPIRRTYLLNDLEALAWSVSVLAADQIDTLHEGTVDPHGSVAVIAAGTGLGVATLAHLDGQLVPRASEGGHVDFAPRNADEQTLADALRREFGRVDVERVVSGRGLAHIHRVLYSHQCETLAHVRTVDDLPPAITRAALDGGCPSCQQTLRFFVSAYGAAAGNLALTVLATGGIYLGGGIAPRIREAMRWPEFLDSFFDKAPMDELVRRIPVKLILNPRAGLLGAATYANLHT
jgi:glucokinase